MATHASALEAVATDAGASLALVAGMSAEVRAALRDALNHDSSLPQQGAPKASPKYRYSAGECTRSIVDWRCDRPHDDFTFDAYKRWVPESATEARRPASFGPFHRCFGSWIGALQAAGAMSDLAIDDAGRLRIERGYRWADEDELGYVPTTSEYESTRKAIQNAGVASGTLRVLPSYKAINKRYATWDEALVAAGLPARGGRSVPSVPRATRPRPGSQFSDQQLVEHMCRARAECGGPLTVRAYRTWREQSKARAKSAGLFIERIPSYDVIWKRSGDWQAASRFAFGSGNGGQLD